MSPPQIAAGRLSFREEDLDRCNFCSSFSTLTHPGSHVGVFAPQVLPCRMVRLWKNPRCKSGLAIARLRQYEHKRNRELKAGLSVLVPKAPGVVALRGEEFGVIA